MILLGVVADAIHACQWVVVCGVLMFGPAGWGTITALGRGERE